MTRKAIGFTVVFLVFATCGSIAAARRTHSDIPETVMITYRAKPGAEADLAKVIAQHWETGRRLDLVLAAPHLTLRMTDEARKPCFVDIFTWRDGDIPDDAPAAIQALWADMARLTEARGGHPGIEITRVTLSGSDR